RVVMRTNLSSVVLAACAASAVAFPGVAHTAPRARVAPPSHIKPTDTIVLEGGAKVSAQKYAEDMNKLQEALEAEGVSVKKSDKRPPARKFELYPGAAQ